MMKPGLIVAVAVLVAAWSVSAAVLYSTSQTHSNDFTDTDTGVTLAQASPPAAAEAPGDIDGRPVSLAEAVRIAERKTGGRAREADRERANNAEVYEVKTISKNGPAKVIVDAATGSIDRVTGPTFWHKFEDILDDEDNREEKAMFRALETATITLPDAIEAAQADAGGQATEAQLKERHGRMQFEVQVLTNGTMQAVTVDPATAGLVALPQRRNGDNGDEDD